jgi:choline dehydrogenase-like flavoprotein
MIDDARKIERGTTIQADVCILGAGAAGITVALQLLRSELRVVLLESGGMSDDPATQSLYEGEVADATLHSPPDKYRLRRFGGSTTMWGGRCVPLEPIDFERRSWIPESGWPISYRDMAMHYPLANSICEAGKFDYDADHLGMHPLIRDFAPENFATDGTERFSCPTNFGQRYQWQLAAAPLLRVILHANCTGLVADNARIDNASVQTLDGNQFSVSASQFIVATGALEAARLLLVSKIGNARVGRHYMCHIAGTVGTLHVKRPADHVWYGYERAPDGVYCRRRIGVTEDTQRREGIGNLVFRLHHPRIPDPRHRSGPLSAIFLARNLISYEYGKRLVTGKPIDTLTWLRHVANVGLDAGGTFRFMWHLLWDRVLAERKFPSIIIRSRTNRFSLDFHAEQVPNPDSRVRLSGQTDRLGMPQLFIDWRYSEADVRTVDVALQLLRTDVSKSGVGELSLDPEETNIEQVIRRDGAYGGHHIGTARMGSDASSGVVDSDCRVFGTNNLYIAGSAVFTTSGQANPTLSIVAMAIRLAGHIQSQASRTVEIVRRPVAATPRW